MKLASLLKICCANKRSFRKLGDNIANPLGELIHIDNGAPILGIAHLDTVKWDTPEIAGDKIYCPQLDDRLGAFVLLSLLPQLGVTCDVLLTDQEEKCDSTAQYFEGREYNWIFSFDRAGSDVVTYQYDCPDWSWALAEYYPIGIGSYSDISECQHLGVCGANIGVGYHRQHTLDCYADLDVTLSQALKFREFAENWAEFKFPHKPKPIRKFQQYRYENDFSEWNYR